MNRDSLTSHFKVVSKLVRQQNELEIAAHKSSLILPPSVKRTTNSLVSEWAAISQLLKKLRPYERCPSPMCLETFSAIPTTTAVVEG